MSFRCHSGSFRCHSGSFRSIPVHSGVIPVHSGPFRSIPVSFRFIPVHSGPFRCHSGSFRSIPPHSGSFRSISVFSNALWLVASSASGQDEPNCTLWLVTRAGKMEPSCSLGTTRCIPQAKCHQKPYNKSFIDQVCSVKMAGHWPSSFFACLWTETKSRSINSLKKNDTNIQPPWPNKLGQ